MFLNKYIEIYVLHGEMPSIIANLKLNFGILKFHYIERLFNLFGEILLIIFYIQCKVAFLSYYLKNFWAKFTHKLIALKLVNKLLVEHEYLIRGFQLLISDKASYTKLPILQEIQFLSCIDSCLYHLGKNVLLLRYVKFILNSNQEITTK